MKRLTNTLNSAQIKYGTQKWYSSCQKPYVVIDLETTGLSSQYERIVEVCAIKFENGVETGRFVSLINPKKKISPAASQVNRITDKMVAAAPSFEDISDELFAFMNGCFLVAHNAVFDIGFLEADFYRCNRDFKCVFYDTLDMARKIFPWLPNHKLQTVLNEIGHVRSEQHRGETDCEGCAAIMKYAVGAHETRKSS